MWNPSRSVRAGLIFFLACCSQLASGQEPESADIQSSDAEVEPAEEPRRERGSIQFLEEPVYLGIGEDLLIPERGQVPPRPSSIASDGFQQERAQAALQSEIIRIETDEGVWSRQLVEQLGGLGRSYQLQGNHAEAIEAYDRAIHINRVNSGLDTIEQIPFVEARIRSHLTLGQWAEADLYTNYLYYLQRKAYGGNDPRLIPVLERLGNWNLQAFHIGFGESLAMRLSSAFAFFSAASERIARHYGKTDGRFARSQHSVAASAYLIARNPDVLREMYSGMTKLRYDELVDSLEVEDMNDVTRTYRAGFLALQEVAASLDGNPAKILEYAQANVDIGDWNLLYNRTQSAEQVYELVWEFLLEQENGEQVLQELFGRVVKLPSFGGTRHPYVEDEIRNGQEQATLQFQDVDIMFDVTPNGETRNLRLVSEEFDETNRDVLRLYSIIRRTKFRPRVEEGEAVLSRDNVFRYRYWY